MTLSNKEIQNNLRDGLPYEYVFDSSDIIRIYAEPFAHNSASCRVLEKAGFQYEGTLRSNAVKNGKVIDMKMYSLLKREV